MVICKEGNKKKNHKKLVQKSILSINTIFNPIVCSVNYPQFAAHKQQLCIDMSFLGANSRFDFTKIGCKAGWESITCYLYVSIGDCAMCGV